MMFMKKQCLLHSVEMLGRYVTSLVESSVLI